MGAIAELRSIGDAGCDERAATATGPSSEARIATPPSAVLRQEQVGFDFELDGWCIGHSVAPA